MLRSNMTALMSTAALGAGIAAFVTVLTATAAANGTIGGADAVLPNGWLIRPPQGLVRQTDTMPQGAAASPDRKLLAVVDSGFNPSTLHLYETAKLDEVATVPLDGAFGRPLWIDSRHVLVAGDNADAIFDVDVATRSVRKIAMPAKSHPIEIARARDGTIAVADDGDGLIRFGALDDLAHGSHVLIGLHPGPLTFSPDGGTLFVADRSGSFVGAVDTKTSHVRVMHTGLHPTALLIVGGELYVAAGDANEVDVFDIRSGVQTADIFVGDTEKVGKFPGASPNAIAASGNYVFVSLGAANSIAVLRHHRIVSRIATGWYPTDVVPVGGRLFLINGKGERSRPNPHFDAKGKSNRDYIAAIQVGSIRTYDIARIPASQGNTQGAVGWKTSEPSSLLSPHGPIKHVFFILKENRSYDQVLGDIRQGNGDPSLVWFGAAVTPNQHALAMRFGLFDNAYTSGEVSDSGHNWSDAAFANDYVERFWPPTYGGRRDNDDVLSGEGAGVPQKGYMWDEAARAHVSFRDYGEVTNVTRSGTPVTAPAPTLRGRYDPKYVAWDLDYSDVDREKEWSREFDAFAKRGQVPQLEYIWLPGDHTYGSRVGKPTPAAYVATNDYALGLMVEKISHSSVWKSSAIFVIEDDAQDGADHVSDQRTTLYIASPYARGGVVHDHYSTVSVLRTVELILGMQPLSAYDAMAVHMDDAFTATPNPQAFTAIRPKVDTGAKNSKVAYGARISAASDFSKPDAIRPGLLLDILAHNRTWGTAIRR